MIKETLRCTEDEILYLQENGNYRHKFTFRKLYGDINSPSLVGLGITSLILEDDARKSYKIGQEYEVTIREKE